MRFVDKILFKVGSNVMSQVTVSIINIVKKLNSRYIVDMQEDNEVMLTIG